MTAFHALGWSGIAAVFASEVAARIVADELPEQADQFVRRVAHSMPPVDFGSTEAIRAMSDAVIDREALLIAERDRLKRTAEELRAKCEELRAEGIACAATVKKYAATGIWPASKIDEWLDERAKLVEEKRALQAEIEKLRNGG